VEKSTKEIVSMRAEDNKVIVRRLIDEVWNKGHLAVLDEIMAIDHDDHDPARPAGDAGGREQTKRTVAAYRAAFPDLQFTVESMLADGDTVVTRWTIRGTQSGLLEGIPPTGNRAAVTGIFINRLAAGQIVESWVNWDQLGLLQQLEVIPAPDRVLVSA
jgi:steroid delta-isomerase-like uncharacterized protein